MLEPMFARSVASWLIAFLTFVNAVCAWTTESMDVPEPVAVPQACVVGTDVRAVGRELVDRVLDVRQRSLRMADGVNGRPRTRGRRVGRATQVDAGVGERFGVAVRGHIERGAVEQADAVEILGRS